MRNGHKLESACPDHRPSGHNGSRTGSTRGRGDCRDVVRRRFRRPHSARADTCSSSAPTTPRTSPPTFWTLLGRGDRPGRRTGQLLALVDEEHPQVPLALLDLTPGSSIGSSVAPTWSTTAPPVGCGSTRLRPPGRGCRSRAASWQPAGGGADPGGDPAGHGNHRRHPRGAAARDGREPHRASGTRRLGHRHPAPGATVERTTPYDGPPSIPTTTGRPRRIVRPHAPGRPVSTGWSSRASGDWRHRARRTLPPRARHVGSGAPLSRMWRPRRRPAAEPDPAAKPRRATPPDRRAGPARSRGGARAPSLRSR